MSVCYDIATNLSVPNEHVMIDKCLGNILWFSVYGVRYDCKLTKRGALKKNSIRRSFS